jgi:dipeptidyl aminopeptidase/acylaminoacyl peptidase
MLLAALFPVLLAAQARDGDILDRTPCAVSTGPGLACQRLTYASGGLSVFAYLLHAHPLAAPAPVIVFNRGGYVVQDQLPVLLPAFRRLVEAGFVIVAPMYRGSDGAPGHDEMGGADLHDLVNIVPVVRALPFADANNLFLYGESRGGVMALLALRDHFPARAAATYGAITDLAAYLQHDSRATAIAEHVWPDFATRREEILSSRSALQWPGKIGAPLLLMHGGADKQVDPLQTLQLAMRLQELRRPYALSIFSGANHTLSEVAAERDRQAIEWFRRHLRP